MRRQRWNTCVGAWAVACAWVALSSWAWAGPSSAQTIDPRLSERLDRETAREVQELIDRVESKGLPSASLYSKALEGAARGVKASVVIAAVRRYAVALESAADRLGPRSTEVELASGAAAIVGGAPADSLRPLRATRQGQSLVVPLVVLSDLLARRVSARDATNLVLAALRAGIADAELVRLRESVQREIDSGVSPRSAAFRVRFGIGTDRAVRPGAPSRPGGETAGPPPAHEPGGTP